METTVKGNVVRIVNTEINIVIVQQDIALMDVYMDGMGNFVTKVKTLLNQS